VHTGHPSLRLNVRVPAQTPELILRCYGVVFGVFIVLVELELPIVLSHAAFMDSWVARGLCIAFVVRFSRFFVCTIACFL